MAIDNKDVVDGIGLDAQRNAIVLLLTDHLPWNDSENSLSEYDHLLLLQQKINAYLSFLEAKQYQDHYPGVVFQMAVIEIHFKYKITESCEEFLNVVQNQVGQYGIKIETNTM